MIDDKTKQPEKENLKDEENLLDSNSSIEPNENAPISKEPVEETQNPSKPQEKKEIASVVPEEPLIVQKKEEVLSEMTLQQVLKLNVPSIDFGELLPGQILEENLIIMNTLQKNLMSWTSMFIQCDVPPTMNHLIITILSLFSSLQNQYRIIKSP